MAETSSHDSKRSWDLDSLAVKTIFFFVILAILAAETGVGWFLGALGGKALELLDVQEAVNYVGILGGVSGFGYALYVMLRRPKSVQSGLIISEEAAREKRKKHDGLICEHRGWDHFIMDIGEAETMACPVCNEIMEVERGIPGIPRYTAYLAGMASDHDLFLCKFRQESWHRQGLELLKVAKETPSVKLQQLLEEEAKTILMDRKPTKEAWKGQSRRSQANVD